MTSPFLGLLADAPALPGLLGTDAPVNPASLAGAVQSQAPSALIPTEPLPNPRRSLLGRVADVLKSGLLAPLHAAENAGGAIHDFAERQAIGDAPTGYEGILTPEQIKALRPSLGQALFGASPGNLGSDMYRKNLENAAGTTLAVQTRQSRQQLFDQIGGPKNGDFAQDPTWIAKALPWALQHGDIELAKTIAPLYNEMLKPATGASAKADVFVDPQGQQHFLTPKGDVEIPAGWKLLQQGGDASSNFDLFKMRDGSLKYLKKGSEVPPGAQRQQDAMTIWKDNRVEGRDFSHRQDSALKEFRTQTADITKAAPVLNQALLTIEDAKNNPDPRIRKVLFSSAIANFVQAADPKAQIRWQLLNYFKENINASAADRVKLLISRLRDGTLPDDVLYGMAAHLQNVRGLMQKEYNSRRSAFLKEHPDLDVDDQLRDDASLFPDAGAPVAAPVKAGSYSPNNPFVKKP